MLTSVSDTVNVGTKSSPCRDTRECGDLESFIPWQRSQPCYRFAVDNSLERSLIAPHSSHTTRFTPLI